jgi:aryl-alcohol dehydrogenase-like predicted oxidoreductase
VLYRNLGSSGLKVSALGLGSWLTFVGDGAGPDRLVCAAFERGVNLFDTADIYDYGAAESALAVVIRGLPRHKLVLATKCFFPMSDDPNDRGLSRKHVVESLHASLKRLAVDYVDLYQCHRFDPETPLAETARAMDDLIGQGKMLYWGVSQWPAERIAEVVELCRREGWHPPISNQPLYNLYERGIEAAILPTCARMGLGLVVYSPLAQGALTGKYRPGQPPPQGSRATGADGAQWLSRYLTPERQAAVVPFVQACERHGLPPLRVALAWCLRQAAVTSVLVGARDEQQLEQNLSAVGVTLPAELLAELEVLFAAGGAV